MIELSKRQLYVFLIVLMTITRKVCLKKGKKRKNYLYNQSNYFLFFCLYLQTIVVKIDLCTFLYKKSFLRCGIHAIHDKYVTLGYQMNL